MRQGAMFRTEGLKNIVKSHYITNVLPLRLAVQAPISKWTYRIYFTSLWNWNAID